MGILQSGVNQVLGTVAIASKLDPNVEKRQQLRDLASQEEQLGQAAEVAAQFNEGETSGRTVGEKLSKSLTEKQAAVAKKRLFLDPSQKNVGDYLMKASASGAGPLFTLPADPDEIMMEQANLEAERQSQLQAQQQAQVQERYNQFVNMFTEGGRYR